MAYVAEYTDTFGGAANFCWVRRAIVPMPSQEKYSRTRWNRLLLMRARKAVGLHAGVKGDVTADYGDALHWVPRGCCTVLMVRWDEYTADQLRAEAEGGEG